MVILDRVMVRRALLRGGSIRRPDDSSEPRGRGQVGANLTARLVLGDPVRRTSFDTAAGGAPPTSRGEGKVGL